MTPRSTPRKRLLRPNPKALSPDPGYRAAPRKEISLWRRFFGEVRSYDGTKLGFFGRMTFEVLWTDDPYYSKLDDHLRSRGL